METKLVLTGDQEDNISVLDTQWNNYWTRRESKNSAKKQKELTYKTIRSVVGGVCVCVYIPGEVYLAGGRSHSRYDPVIPPSHAPQPRCARTHTDTITHLTHQQYL